MVEFGAVIVIATLFSLLVSFTLTPMLAARWSLRTRPAEMPRALTWFTDGFDRLTLWYSGRALPLALRHRLLTVCFCIYLLGMALALPVLGFVQSEFISGRRHGLDRDDPDLSDRDAAGDDPSCGRQARVGDPDAAGDPFDDYDDGDETGRLGRDGGRQRRAHDRPARKDQRKLTNKMAEQIRSAGPDGPGAVLTVAAEGGSASGGDPISYALTGPEAAIGPAAEKLAEFIRGIPGTVNVQTGAETEGDRLNITIDRARAAVLGISPGVASQAARIAIGGAVATKVRTEDGLVDVRVQLPERYRNHLDDVENIKVRAEDGSIYRLADVASSPGQGPDQDRAAR